MIQMLFVTLISIHYAVTAGDKAFADLGMSFVIMNPECHAKSTQPIIIKEPVIIKPSVTCKMIKEASAYDADIESLRAFVTFLYNNKINHESLLNGPHLRAYIYWETIEAFLNQKFYYNTNLKDEKNKSFYCNADDSIISTIFGIGLSLRGIPPIVTSNGILKKKPIDLINPEQTIIDGVHAVIKELVRKYQQQKDSSLYNKIPAYTANLFPPYAPLLLTMELPKSFDDIHLIPAWCEQMKLYASNSYTLTQLKAIME